jgi:hypothetical protein
MSEPEKDYSDFMGWMSNNTNIFIFMGGFTFTILTLLVINLPNPNTVMAQLILLFITIMFDLLLYLILLVGVESLQFCRNVPSFGKRLKFCSTLSNVVLVLWGFLVPSVFLLWNMINLAIITTIIWIVFIIINNFTIRKQNIRYRKITEIKRDIE